MSTSGKAKLDLLYLPVQERKNTDGVKLLKSSMFIVVYTVMSLLVIVLTFTDLYWLFCPMGQ